MTETQEPIRTFDEAYRAGAYGLARRWADAAGEVDRTADGELEQIAIMSALAHWLTNWRPIHIHRAALAGADLASITFAMGGLQDTMRTAWKEWAKGQRELYDLYDEPGKTRLGIPPAEYDQVVAVLWPTEGGQ
ncbi:hypothetical protein ACQP2F_46450 (plasmid) [Actinoplanes sp. CA-030573]|uniref:hypothetical protein n=1 Tax=Actinoplanes sp. CA-030573 TaxID=3239898 RepID=UPI003D8F517C